MAFDGSLKFDTKIDTNGFEKGVSSLNRAAKSFEKKIHQMGKRIDQSIGKSEKVTALESEISATEEKIRALVSEMKEMEEAKLPTKEYTELEKQADRAGKKLEGLLDRKEKFESTGRKTNTSSWKGLLYDIDLASKKYDALTRKKEAMESDGTAYTSGSSSSSYQKKADSLADLNNKLYEQKRMLSEVEAAELAASQSGQEYVSLIDSLKFHVKATGGLLKGFGKNVVIGLATSPVAGFTSAMKGALWITERTSSAFKKVGFNAVKKSITGATRALSKFNKVLWSIGINSNKSKRGFSMIGMLGKSLMFSMVFRSLSAISNALKEGMQNFAQYSGSFNSVMTSFTGSLTQFKNSIAAAFSPVTSIAIPALDALIQKLIQVINVIGQFMSSMSGKNTFTRAVKVNDDYAASLKKTGGAAKSAGKEAKKALAPFDDLVQIQQQGADASGGGTVGTDPSQMFTEETIENGISGFANKLKELIDAEDWGGIGQMIGEKVNKAIDSIDYSGIGSRIGYMINGAVQTAYHFLDTVNFINIGKYIAELINSALEQVDFTFVGAIVIKWFTLIPDIVIGFLSELDWGLVAKSISDFFIGAFDEATKWLDKYDWGELGDLFWQKIKDAIAGIDWGSLATSIFTFLGTSLRSAGRFLGEFFGGIGDDIKKWWIEEIQGVTWKEVADNILNAIGKGFASIGTWVYENILDPFITALTGKPDWFDEFQQFGENLWDGFTQGIKDFFSDPFAFIKDNIIDPFVNGVKNLFGIHSPSTVMAEFGQYLWEGFCNGIKEFFSNPGTFIKNNITDPFVNGVKNLLGIHSPSTVMEGIGSNTVAGFNQGVTNEQSASQNVIQTWAEGISKWFSNKFGISNNSADESRKWATGIMSGFNTTVNRQYTDSQSVMEKWAENVRQWFIGDSDTKGINEASWKKFAENIIQAFINAINIGHIGTKEPMELWASHVQEWFWGDTDPSGTGGMYTAFYKMAKRINEGFANGVSDFSHMAKSAIREWADEIMEEAEEAFDIHSPSKEFRTIAEYVVKGFNEGITELAASSQSTVQKWLDGILHVFDGVDITVPVGIDIPNADSYLPRIATGSIVPPRAGEASLAAIKNYGSVEQEESLAILLQKIDELIAQIREDGGRPIEIVLNLTGNLASLARILKPELDKEAARKGIKLVVVGGV